MISSTSGKRKHFARKWQAANRFGTACDSSNDFTVVARPGIEQATIFISLYQQIFICVFGLKCAILLSFNIVDRAMEGFLPP